MAGAVKSRTYVGTSTNDGIAGPRGHAADDSRILGIASSLRRGQTRDSGPAERRREEQRGTGGGHAHTRAFSLPGPAGTGQRRRVPGTGWTAFLAYAVGRHAAERRPRVVAVLCDRGAGRKSLSRVGE